MNLMLFIIFVNQTKLENKQIEKQNKENNERERRINIAQNSIESSLNDQYLESAKKEINDFLLLELNSSKRDYANGKLKEINYFLNEKIYYARVRQISLNVIKN